MTLTDFGYAVEELNLRELDDRQLRPLVDLFNTLGAEREPRHTDLTPEEFRIFSDAPGQVRRRFAVRDRDGLIVALLQVSHADDGSNPHLLRTSISVSPEHRRRGIGSALLDHAAAIAKELGRPTLSGNISDTVPASGLFADAVGARRTLDFHTNVVRIADLDRSLLHSWQDQGPGRAPGYSVRLTEGAYPEDLLEGIAHLYYVLERDMPMPEGRQPREWTPELVAQMIGHFLEGTELITAVAAHEASGEAAGMSQLGRRRTEPKTWFVTTTMVDPAHRGHGLGKWVKAAACLHALERWPGAEYMETGNAFTNEAMLGINHAMGFRHEFTWTDVEVAVEQVESYLRSREG